MNPMHLWQINDFAVRLLDVSFNLTLCYSV